MAGRKGRYLLNGRSIQKREASAILGRAYCMPQSTAINQFESLVSNYFRMCPMATYYMDPNTGVAYLR